MQRSSSLYRIGIAILSFAVIGPGTSVQESKPESALDLEPPPAVLSEPK